MKTDAELIWKLPHLSQECENGPVIQTSLRKLWLKYDYETKDGSYEWETIEFDRIRMYQFIPFILCTVEHIAAFDQILMINNSEIVDRIYQKRRQELAELRHYRIFFNEFGCYDIICEDIVIPEL